MTDIYKTPESKLVQDVGSLPTSAYVFLALLGLDALIGIAINLLGAYGLDPVKPVSGEFALVLGSTALIIGGAWHLTCRGSKVVPTIIYVFIVMTLFMEGENWFKQGIFTGVAEFLTFIDFLLFLAGLYMVKFPLKNWFVR